MLVASSMAQLAINPYAYAAGYATPYAAGYGYNTYSAGRTAFDIFPTPAVAPVAALPAAYNAYSAYNGLYSPYAFNYGSYAPAFAAPAAAAVVPEAAAEPAVVVKTAEADAEIIEAVPAAEAAVELPKLRPIFPVFSSDLRGASPFIQFARPSEIAAIKVDSEEKPDDFVVITPEARYVNEGTQ